MVQRLLDLNRTFYQRHAAAFAETRTRPQPGVQRLLRALPRQAAVLDLGCGHGLVAQELARRGHRGRYVGMDASQALLEIARQGPAPPGATFLLADLAQAGWAQGLAGPFDVALTFALLHHLPGQDLRLALLRQVHDLLAPEGRLMLSVWNFLASERLRARVVPWEETGLTAADVDPGDHLLDWRHRGHGLRYVHHFTEAELRRLAAQAGFEVLDTFTSDGEGGRLGVYQVWSAAGR